MKFLLFFIVPGVFAASANKKIEKGSRSVQLIRIECCLSLLVNGIVCDVIMVQLNGNCWIDQETIILSLVTSKYTLNLAIKCAVKTTCFL